MNTVTVADTPSHRRIEYQTSPLVDANLNERRELIVSNLLGQSFEGPFLQRLYALLNLFEQAHLEVGENGFFLYDEVALKKENACTQLLKLINSFLISNWSSIFNDNESLIKPIYKEGKITNAREQELVRGIDFHRIAFVLTKFPDATLHLALEIYLIEHLYSVKSEKVQKQIAKLLLYVFSYFARMYELPVLTGVAQDSSFAILDAQGYTLFLEEWTAKVGRRLEQNELIKLKITLQENIAAELKIPLAAIKCTIRQKSILSSALKLSEGRGLKDWLGVSIVIDSTHPDLQGRNFFSSTSELPGLLLESGFSFDITEVDNTYLTPKSHNDSFKCLKLSAILPASWGTEVNIPIEFRFFEAEQFEISQRDHPWYKIGIQTEKRMGVETDHIARIGDYAQALLMQAQGRDPEYHYLNTEDVVAEYRKFSSDKYVVIATSKGNHSLHFKNSGLLVVLDEYTRLLNHGTNKLFNKFRLLRVEKVGEDLVEVRYDLEIKGNGKVEVVKIDDNGNRKPVPRFKLRNFDKLTLLEEVDGEVAPYMTTNDVLTGIVTSPEDPEVYRRFTARYPNFTFRKLREWSRRLRKINRTLQSDVISDRVRGDEDHRDLLREVRDLAQRVEVLSYLDKIVLNEQISGREARRLRRTLTNVYSRNFQYAVSEVVKKGLDGDLRSTLLDQLYPYGFIISDIDRWLTDVRIFKSWNSKTIYYWMRRQYIALKSTQVWERAKEVKATMLLDEEKKSDPALCEIETASARHSALKKEIETRVDDLFELDDES